ncbi:13766_t:CDS:2, partial [Funneliformis geosporum]
IDTKDATPIKQRFYRTSYNNQEFIKKEIQKLLKSGLIRPSKSQWTSPVVVVEKKNSKKRLCIDYRKLYSVTKKNNYPLPRIDNMLETLEGSQWFTSLDLSSGFLQVELELKDREKTIFITRFGTYEFNQYVVVYVDNINISSRSFEEYLLHLKQIAQKEYSICLDIITTRYFRKIKVQVDYPSILAYPNFDKPFILYTDASSFALKAILSQKDNQKREHVIAYASRTLKPLERKYSVTEQECLAVVWAT